MKEAVESINYNRLNYQNSLFPKMKGGTFKDENNIAENQ